VIDGRGVAMAPLRKRVWKLLEIKEIERKGRKQKVESRNQKGAKQDRRKELEEDGGGRFASRLRVKTFKNVTLGCDVAPFVM
jgi:hypothetical protein